MCMHVDYNDLTICHTIENNLHKQQCTTGFAETHKYNGLFKIYIISPRECGLCTHHISSLTALERWLAECVQ